MQVKKQRSQEEVSLQGSLFLLRQMRLISHLKDAAHIRNILQDSTRQKPQLVAECRFVYFLWGVLREDFVAPHIFYSLLRLLVDCTDLDDLRKDLTRIGDSTYVEGLIQAWQSLPSEAYGHSHSVTHENDENDQHFLNTQNSIQVNKIAKASSSFHNSSRIQPQSVRTSVTPSYCSGQKTSKRTQHVESKNTNRNSNVAPSLSERWAAINQQWYEPLSLQREGDLVKRLYRVPDYQARQAIRKARLKEEERNELAQCTFQPAISRGERERKQSKSVAQPIKGYQKTIQRLKQSYQQGLKLRKATQFRVIENSSQENKNNLWKSNEPTVPFDPCFHYPPQRSKVLFQIEFDLGRNRIKVKVREGEQAEHIAANICKIFKLKEQSKETISEVLQREINRCKQQQKQEELNRCRQQYAPTPLLSNS